MTIGLKQSDEVFASEVRQSHNTL